MLKYGMNENSDGKINEGMAIFTEEFAYLLNIVIREHQRAIASKLNISVEAVELVTAYEDSEFLENLEKNMLGNALKTIVSSLKNCLRDAKIKESMPEASWLYANVEAEKRCCWKAMAEIAANPRTP